MTKIKAKLTAPLERIAGFTLLGNTVDFADMPFAGIAVNTNWAAQNKPKVEKVIAIHDVGRAVNPRLCEGQIEGSVHMGLGYALTEAYEIVDGVPLSESLKSLGIIPAATMPPWMVNSPGA